MKKICDICGFETENGRVMSNHKRWKHSGVRFSDEALQRLHERKKKRIVREVVCASCGVAYNIEELEGSEPKKNYFCSRSCANRRPYSKERKESLEKTLLSKGVQLTTSKKCEICGKEFTSRNRTCSKACGTKLAQKTKESRKNLTEKKVYRLACSFRFALNSYPEEFDFSLVEKYGWYKATNRGGDGSGVSRDHMVSVDYGWKHQIDPAIIRHPANCKLMIHSDNFKKGADCSISLEELLLRIAEWDNKYGVVA